jgi:hypothetical protein
LVQSTLLLIFGDGSDLAEVDLPGDSAVSLDQAECIKNVDRALEALTIEKCGCCREKHIRFELERNDPLLNGYNPAIILAWCANIDVKPVMSTDAALKGVPLLLFKLTTYNTETTYPSTPASPNSRLPRFQNCC